MSSDRKAEFIRVLANYLAGPNQALKSMEFQMGQSHAKEWAELRQATPLFGYPTVDEAIKTLTEFLK